MLAENRRNAVRIPADILKQLPADRSGSVGVMITNEKCKSKHDATLQDLHKNGMCFFFAGHSLQEGDTLKVDACLGEFPFVSDAVVRWTLSNFVGVEFLDSDARNAAMLAELYTEKLLSFRATTATKDSYSLHLTTSNKRTVIPI